VPICEFLRLPEILRPQSFILGRELSNVFDSCVPKKRCQTQPFISRRQRISKRHRTYRSALRTLWPVAPVAACARARRRAAASSHPCSEPYSDARSSSSCTFSLPRFHLARVRLPSPPSLETPRAFRMPCVSERAMFASRSEPPPSSLHLVPL
jgi:hypothetical protein